MNASNGWHKAWIWFLIVPIILFVGVTIYALLTPPVYQSQIAVIELEPCKSRHGKYLVECHDPKRMLAHLANSDTTRQAVYNQLVLPNDTHYDVSTAYNFPEIILSIKTESPELAQEIAAETIGQLNVWFSQEEFNNYHSWEARVAKLEQELQLSYPPPDGPNGNQTKNTTLYHDLMQAQEILDNLEPRKKLISNGEYRFYEVLEPATYPETAVPYWRHVILQYLNPAALDHE